MSLTDHAPLQRAHQGDPVVDGRAQAWLRRDIVLGLRAPGDIVDEQRLAEEYGVHPASVRMACTALSHDGYTVPIADRRHIVAPVDPADVQQVYELRLIVEPATAALAADRIEEDVARALRDTVVAPPTGDEHATCMAAMEADRAFHVLVAKASGNARLIELVDQMFASMARLIHATLHGDLAHDPGNEHHHLVDAILGGEREAAEQIARYHITQSRRRVIEALVRERAAMAPAASHA